MIPPSKEGFAKSYSSGPFLRLSNGPICLMAESVRSYAALDSGRKPTSRR
jgi:hypothetical protein